MNPENDLQKKILLPVLSLVIFTIAGIAVFLYKQKLQYLFLFAGMGLLVTVFDVVMRFLPQYRQLFRRSIQALIGGIIFFGISLGAKVNFQFAGVIFDIYAVVITGALIQFILARLVLPFFIGNAFCSWVCWDGACFELAGNVTVKSSMPKHRSSVIAFAYLLLIFILASAAVKYGNPAYDDGKRLGWIIAENAAILFLGIGLSRFWGSRAYCRILCPFLTISGLFSKYALFKIAPVHPEKCTSCGRCSSACPMLIDVMDFVKKEKRINSRNCIVCERCVSSCVSGSIGLAAGFPWR